MSDTSSTLLKPLAHAGRGGRAAFAALLSVAGTDVVTAIGFADAYQGLPRGARKAIVDAVVSDARINGLRSTGLLACFWAVETDSCLAQRIGQLIGSGHRTHPRVEAAPKALIAGDLGRGAVLVLRPLHTDFCEACRLVWSHETGITEVVFEPLLDSDKIGPLVRKLPWGLRFRPTGYREALDRAAQALWAYRETWPDAYTAEGLPAGLSHFGTLL